MGRQLRDTRSREPAVGCLAAHACHSERRPHPRADQPSLREGIWGPGAGTCLRARITLRDRAKHTFPRGSIRDILVAEMRTYHVYIMSDRHRGTLYTGMTKQPRIPCGAAQEWRDQRLHEQVPCSPARLLRIHDGRSRGYRAREADQGLDPREEGRTHRECEPSLG
jgi:hypothetical protein